MTVRMDWAGITHLQVLANGSEWWPLCRHPHSWIVLVDEVEVDGWPTCLWCVVKVKAPG